MHNFNDFQEAKTYLYIGHWKYGRNMTFIDLVSDWMIVTIAWKWVHNHTQLLKIWLQVKDTKCYSITDNIAYMQQWLDMEDLFVTSANKAYKL